MEFLNQIWMGSNISHEQLLETTNRLDKFKQNPNRDRNKDSNALSPEEVKQNWKNLSKALAGLK